MDSIIKQLVDIHYNKEDFLKNKLLKEEAYMYHEHMLNKNILSCYIQDNIVLGYYQCFRINFEQFGRIICKAPFFDMDEDLVSGNIAYVANVWIDKEHRRGLVYKTLRNQFYKQHHTAEYYVGEANRKKDGLVKVFKKDNLKSSLFTLGE